MGLGFVVKCTHCDKEYELYDDYGGLKYYYSYYCRCCNDIFILSFINKNGHEHESCPKCKGNRTEKINVFNSVKEYDEPTLLRCPKCEKFMILDSDFFFDD